MLSLHCVTRKQRMFTLHFVTRKSENVHPVFCDQNDRKCSPRIWLPEQDKMFTLHFVTRKTKNVHLAFCDQMFLFVFLTKVFALHLTFVHCVFILHHHATGRRVFLHKLDVAQVQYGCQYDVHVVHFLLNDHSQKMCSK